MYWDGTIITSSQNIRIYVELSSISVERLKLIKSFSKLFNPRMMMFKVKLVVVDGMKRTIMTYCRERYLNSGACKSSKTFSSISWCNSICHYM